MKNKYIVFFKGSMVFLFILLIVVGFSFGVSFSSFVYSSNDHRAVEMYINHLDYKIFINEEETNDIELNSGNNLVNIKIKSLNKIDSYFKLVSNSELDTYYFDSKSDEIINSMEEKELTLLIYNNTTNKMTINFKVEGGFITNTIDDVKVSEGYYEINDSIDTGKEFVYNNTNYRLLGINKDGTIELIGETINNEVLLNGSEGFNKSVREINKLNEILTDINIIESRNINLSDIQKYTSNDIVKYTITPAKYRSDDGIYIPSSLTSSETLNDFTNISIYSSPIINIDNDIFKKSKYYDLFVSDTPYYLSTTYNESNNDNIEFGIYEVSDKIKKLKLYDWDNNSYDTRSNVRTFVKLSNEVNIKDID